MEKRCQEPLLILSRLGVPSKRSSIQGIKEDSKRSGVFVILKPFPLNAKVDEILAQENPNPDIPPQGGDMPFWVSWMCPDRLGTIRHLFNYPGYAYIHYKYTAFGTWSAGGSGSMAQPIKTFDDPSFNFFAGREWDADIGLYNNRARWYDANIGRFISEDPIGFKAKDENLYRYVGNEPTDKTDPMGLLCCSLGMNLNIAAKCAWSCNPSGISSLRKTYPGIENEARNIANREYPTQNHPENDYKKAELRHCSALATIAKMLGSDCAICVGRIREQYQE